MPLSLPTIQNEFAKMLDKDNPNFVGYPTTPIEVATNWATAINNYASSVLPFSASSAAAYTALYNALLLGSAPGAFFSALVTGMSAYALTLATGMQPAFTATPPPTPISFSAVLSLPLGTDVSVIISTFATIVDTWFRTGLATLNTPPNTIVPWN